MLNETNEAIIINTLSNIFDWDSENLEEDFCKLISYDLQIIDYDLAKKIFNDYNKISPIEREAIDFDYYLFLKKVINHHIS